MGIAVRTPELNGIIDRYAPPVDVQKRVSAVAVVVHSTRGHPQVGHLRPCVCGHVKGGGGVVARSADAAVDGQGIIEIYGAAHDLHRCRWRRRRCVVEADGRILHHTLGTATRRVEGQRTVHDRD